MESTHQTLERLKTFGRTRVAVYGTLRAGCVNHTRLANQDDAALNPAKWEFGSVSRVGDGIVNGFGLFFAQTHARYPYAAESPGGRARVEVYEISSSRLAMPLDRLEGYPHLYDRKIVEVTLDDGSTVEAWMYIQREMDWEISDRRVPNDDWINVVWSRLIGQTVDTDAEAYKGDDEHDANQ